MLTSRVLPMVATAAFVLAGCATQSAAHEPAGFSGPVARGLELPASAGSGEPREVHVLLDEPALKLATIVLRQGKVLPGHETPVPVTIVALQGSGTVIAGGERLRLDTTHAVALAAKVEHVVEPDAGSDLVLLVHHLGRSKEAHK